MPSYQLGETFDLGRAYSQAQAIKESKQNMDYRALQIEELKNPTQDPLKLLKLQVEQERLKALQNPTKNPDTPDIANDRVRFVSALFHGAYSQKDPEAARQSTLDAINIAMQHGSIHPEEGKRLIEGLGKVPADQIHPMLKARFDEMDAMVSAYDKKNNADGEKETFSTNPKDFYKINGKWYVQGNKGGRRALPSGFEPPADAGSDSTAPESLMWRETAAAYGGLYDPKTQEFGFTDPAQKVKAQRTMSQASRLYKDGNGSITPSEAVDRALNNGAAPGQSGGPTNPRGGAKPSSGYAKEGDIVSNGKQRLQLKNGQWVPVP